MGSGLLSRFVVYVLVEWFIKEWNTGIPTSRDWNNGRRNNGILDYWVTAGLSVGVEPHLLMQHKHKPLLKPHHFNIPSFHHSIILFLSQNKVTQ
jgi:hypothetical protein